MNLAKEFEKADAISLNPGVNDSHELINKAEKEKFKLDVWRGTIRLSKVRHQHRARKTCVLVRLEVDGAPHQNPDGVKVPCPHIHIYREGYDDKWAYPIDENEFTDLNDPEQLFKDFCAYCNITNLPVVVPYSEQNQLL